MLYFVLVSSNIFGNFMDIDAQQSNQDYFNMIYSESKIKTIK